MKLSLPLFAATTIFTSTVAFTAPSRLERRTGSSSTRYGSTETDVELAKVVSTKPTGTSFLPDETVERCKVGSIVEKAKLEKDPINAWVDVYEYARKIREGEMTWEEVESADLDTVRLSCSSQSPNGDHRVCETFKMECITLHNYKWRLCALQYLNNSVSLFLYPTCSLPKQRLKYVGMLHRNKRTPGQFMLRLKVPNGIVNSDQMRFYAECVEKYGPEMGVVDITTRANIQLRGVKIEDAPTIIDGLHARNQTSFQSALDSVRNMVGSPLAGIDDQEMVDTRELCNALNDLVSLDPVTQTRGNPQWANLPRKFNIAISGSRDDFAHTHINDVGLQ
jgi:hypothetical protein